MAMFVYVSILAAVDIMTERTTHEHQPVHEISGEIVQASTTHQYSSRQLFFTTSYAVANRFPRGLGRQDILEPCLQAS